MEKGKIEQMKFWKNMKNKIKKTKIENMWKFKSQIQCFLKEKPMFYLQRQNRKNEKMKMKIEKSQTLKKHYKFQISYLMFS